jgi:Zn-dependent protease with chaperone function
MRFVSTGQIFGRHSLSRAFLAGWDWPEGQDALGWARMSAIGLSFCMAALLMAFMNWLALIPWRKAGADIFWADRAALLFPARASAATNIWLIAASLVCACRLALPGSSLFSAGVGGFLGAIVGMCPMDRAIFPDLTLERWLHLAAGNLLLSAFFWLVLAAFADVMPPAFNWKTWVLFGVFSFFLFALRFGLALRLIKWIGLLRKPTSRLTTIVDEVSGEMGIPVRATWIWRNAASNAVAFTMTRELAFSERLMDTLSDNEIRAVCAHELGHLAESRRVTAVRLISSLWPLPIVLLRPTVVQYGWEHAYALACGVLLLRVLLKRTFRSMEVRADRMAAERTSDSSDYAHALETLYRVNQMPVVLPLRRRGIHPDLYDRLNSIGANPEYPKPLPPRGRAWTTWLLLTITLILAVEVFAF